MKFITGNESIGSVSWEINLTWKVKKLFRENGLSLKPNSGEGYNVDTIKTLEIIIKDGTIIESWDRDEEISLETIWSLPAIHTDELAVKIALFIITGVEIDENDTENILNNVPLVSK